ncbi:MAG: DEAD/DEAH box helicase family protein [Mycobacteriales bacterium]
MNDPADPYGIPTTRRDSVTPLVAGIRVEVDAWRAGGYRGATQTSLRLLEHWFLDEHETGPGEPFQWYFAQREAVETLVYLHEVARLRTTGELVGRFAAQPVAAEGQDWPRYVVKMATGSGKTKVMSLALTWAYFRALRDDDSALSSTSLVVAPNLIVYERLREDFEAARVFRHDPLVPPEWKHDFDLRVCLRGDPVPLQAPGVLLLTNVQQLYERRTAPDTNPVSALLGAKPPKDLYAGEPPLLQVAARGRVLVVNDEAHHLHDEVKADTGEPLQAVRSIARLHALAENGVAAQLDFSATPRNVQGRVFAETVVDYPLAQAIEDGIVKRPVIGELSGGAPEVTSDDASVRYRQRIGAGVAKWRDYVTALAPAGRRPLLFVMAEDTSSADQIAAYLQTVPDLAGKVLTIHVNMAGAGKGEVKTAELEDARRWAREVDSADSPYAAIVSVLMLREGWDVRNVSVIVPLRALTSKNRILPEQTLGRGLRRMTPPGSGVDETVVVIEHEAFRDLWDKALDDEGLEVERTDIDDVQPQAQVIAVEPERMAYDIDVPQLPRLLSRHSGGIERLRVEDLPARQLPLPAELRSDAIDYVGRDMLSGAVVERSTYALDRPEDPTAVLAWYVNELQRATKLTGQFAVLAPLVKGYVEDRLFGGPVDFDDPRVLYALAEPPVQETVLGVLRTAIDDATLQTGVAAAGEVKGVPLSTTRPFLWSREVATADKSVFALQPCDSGLEIDMCRFLDRCSDVVAFAKLAREVRFSLEYRAEGGRLAYYYPDFLVRMGDGRHLVVETKGLADLDVPHKDERARRWAVDATVATGTRWSYARIDEDLFRAHELSLVTLDALLETIAARHREQVLRGLTPELRSEESLAERTGRLQQQLAGVTGIDEEIDRLRNDPRG